MPKKAKEPQIEVRELNSLRFVAALYVFAFHLQIRWPIASPDSWLGQFLNQGATAMTLFFMLSGFVLMNRYQSAGKLDIKNYAINRIARIYPVYFLSLLLTIPWIVGSKIDGIQQLPEILRLILAIAFLVITALTLIQSWLTPLFSFWNFGGSWSISVEAALSAAFVKIREVVMTRSLKQQKRIAGLLFLGAIAPGLTISLLANSGAGPIAQFYSMPIFRISEFALGCIAASIAEKIKFKTLTLIFTTILLPALMIFYLGRFAYVSPLYVTHNWIVVPTTFLFLIAASQGSKFTSILRFRISNYLGKVSYSFYSIQLVLIALLVQFHAELEAWPPVVAWPPALHLFSFCSLLLASVFCFHFFESPARSFVKRALSDRWKVVENR